MESPFPVVWLYVICRSGDETLPDWPWLSSRLVGDDDGW